MFVSALPQNATFVKELYTHDGVLGTLSTDIYYVPTEKKYYKVNSNNSHITSIYLLNDFELGKYNVKPKKNNSIKTLLSCFG